MFTEHVNQRTPEDIVISQKCKYSKSNYLGVTICIWLQNFSDHSYPFFHVYILALYASNMYNINDNAVLSICCLPGASSSDMSICSRIVPVP